MVLKFLPWRNTDAQGECSPVFHGEAFDLDRTSTLPEIPFWEPVDRGHGGNWSSDRRFEWSWREWLASLLGPDLENILQGGHVLEIGCGPMVGLSSVSS